MRWFVMILALSACGATSGPSGTASGGSAPRTVTLYRDNVVVEMRNGAVCTGVRENRAGPWATTLKGCAHTWPVAVLRPTTRPRLPLQGGAADPWVTLSPPDGPTLGFGPNLGS